ncbi:hypothetical protein Ancab_030895 [Ancistrocladus abbreviatus]
MSSLLQNPVIAIFFFFSPIASSLSLPSPDATVYDLLPTYGLPSGLLPNSVKNFSLSSDGSFNVELSAPCYVQFDYMVYYDRIISGKLKYGSIKDLEGIQVQKFLLWLTVDEIVVDLPPSNYIYFHLGMISKKLDVAQFREVRACRNTASSVIPWNDLLGY